MATIIVALDLSTADAALDLVDRLGSAVTHYKIGPALFTRTGPDIVREVTARGKRVFLDLKFHDIPHTVARAVEAAAQLGVEMLTLHASGGRAMLSAARAAAGPAGPRLLAVTLLTSLSPADLEEVWAKELRSLREEVSRLAALAADAQLDGVVASALEAEALKRRHGPGFLVVTPGIRPSESLVGDHLRYATPTDAVRAGADYLVVGRPVFEAPDPASVVLKLHQEMEAAVLEMVE